jgi:hypothetical protein
MFRKHLNLILDWTISQPIYRQCIGSVKTLALPELFHLILWLCRTVTAFNNENGLYLFSNPHNSYVYGEHALQHKSGNFLFFRSAFFGEFHLTNYECCMWCWMELLKKKKSQNYLHKFCSKHQNLCAHHEFLKVGDGVWFTLCPLRINWIIHSLLPTSWRFGTTIKNNRKTLHSGVKWKVCLISEFMAPSLSWKGAALSAHPCCL